MQFFLILLSMIFSFVSLGMMGYLAMDTQLGPWIAPLFVVVCMVIAIPFVARKWFQEYAVFIIAAGSMGGMIGTCLGFTIPSFYFLNNTTFNMWIENKKWEFIGMISLFVLLAGSLGAVITFLIKDYLMIEKKYPFPMSQLIYDMLAADKTYRDQKLMWNGIFSVSIWNICAQYIRPYFSISASQFHMIPLLLSVGFVVGKLSIVGIALGGLTHLGSVYLIYKPCFFYISQQHFLVMFCLGMLIAVMLSGLQFLMQSKIIKEILYSPKLRLQFRNVRFWLNVIIFIPFILYFLSIYHVLMMLPFLILISWYVAKIVAQVGIIELDSFVWLILLPCMYGFRQAAMSDLLVIALFATLCLGTVVVLLFSYKLANLAGISFNRILVYQRIGFLTACISSGLVIWWYIHILGFDSMQLFAPKARELESFINFGQFNFDVVFIGFVWGLIIRAMMQKELLVVIGSTLMAPMMSWWLILAGTIAYLLPNREKYYPFCFGIYAAHALWILLRAFALNNWF